MITPRSIKFNQYIFKLSNSCIKINIIEYYDSILFSVLVKLRYAILKYHIKYGNKLKHVYYF